MPSFAYDVFISYSHNDKEWVKDWLLPHLESAGIRICIDYRDFKIGLPALDNMADAAVKSSKTLFVMTPNWTVSEFSQFEALVTQTIDPIGRKGRLLPLMLKDSDLPARLQLLTYADFKDPSNWDAEIERLIADIRQPPTALSHTGAAAPLAPNLVHPYPLQANFTGRLQEREELTKWLRDDLKPIYELIAIGGMGKSALTWYWLIHDVLASSDIRTAGVLWWSYYENESSFAKFIDTALKYVSGKPIAVEQFPTTYDRTQELRRLLQDKHILFVLDGFERQLRDYASLDAAYRPDVGSNVARESRACVDPNAARLLTAIGALTTRAKVLITTRLPVSDLQDRTGAPLSGVVERELKELEPDDAVRFMHAQGVTKGTSQEIRRACAEYGYHPLSLRLLSGLIKQDPKAPGDIAAAPHHDVHSDLIQRQNHILKRAYEVLPKRERALLSRIAAFRGSSTFEALTIFNALGSARRFSEALEDLRVRGLLQRDFEHNRYDLHPVVRHYAYFRLANKSSVHTKLRDYFATFPVIPDDKVESVEDLAPLIELYHHTVRSGRYEESLDLLTNRLVPDPLHFRFGAYNLIIELVSGLLPKDEGDLPLLNDETAQAWVLNALGIAYGASGESRRASLLFEQFIEIAKKEEIARHVAVVLGNLGGEQLTLGELAKAEQSFNEEFSIYTQLKLEEDIAQSRGTFSQLPYFEGDFATAHQSLELAEQLAKKHGLKQTLAVVESFRAVGDLLAGDIKGALESAEKLQKLASVESVERDTITAEWLLGATLVRDGQDLGAAANHLTEALSRCRRINLLQLEPDILLAWAQWHYFTGNHQDARVFAHEALDIADRCEYRLKQADIHNFLARLSLDANDREEALKHAGIAKERAWCNGPPHCYKPALEAAEAILKLA